MGLAAEDIEAVRCDIFQWIFDNRRRRRIRPKDRPLTKEQADYNLKYLMQPRSWTTKSTDSARAVAVSRPPMLKPC